MTQAVKYRRAAHKATPGNEGARHALADALALQAFVWCEHNEEYDNKSTGWQTAQEALKEAVGLNNGDKALWNKYEDIQHKDRDRNKQRRNLASVKPLIVLGGVILNLRKEFEESTELLIDAVDMLLGALGPERTAVSAAMLSKYIMRLYPETDLTIRRALKLHRLLATTAGLVPGAGPRLARQFKATRAALEKLQAIATTSGHYDFMLRQGLTRDYAHVMSALRSDFQPGDNTWGEFDGVRVMLGDYDHVGNRQLCDPRFWWWRCLDSCFNLVFGCQRCCRGGGDSDSE